MKYLLFLTILFCANTVQAKTTICSISGMFMFTKISWNEETKNAEATAFFGPTVYPGNYIYSRKHDSGEAKTFRFSFSDKKSAGTDMAEFVIYPKDKEGKQHILGIAFIVKNKERYVDFSYGSHDIQCLST